MATSADKITAAKKQRGRDILGVCLLAAGVVGFVLLLIFFIDPLMQYTSANKAIEEHNYGKAVEIYESLDGFLNSEKKLVAAYGDYAADALASGDYTSAMRIVEEAGLEDSFAAEEPELFIHYADSLVERGLYEDAVPYYEKVSAYEGVAAKYDAACLQSALFMMEAGTYEQALSFFDKAQSLDWFATLSENDALNRAGLVAEYSFLRAHAVYDRLAQSSDSAQKMAEQLTAYLPYCGKKSIVSASDGAETMVGQTGFFDFLLLDETEYLSLDGQSFYAAAEAGVYAGETIDEQAGAVTRIRFSLLENNSILQNYTDLLSGETNLEMSFIWS